MDGLQRWLTLLTALGAALAALAYIVRVLWRGFRIVQRVLDLLEHELTPNGGSSMRDEITAVARTVGNVQADVAELVKTKQLAHELLQMQLDTLNAELNLADARPSRHRKATDDP